MSKCLQANPGFANKLQNQGEMNIVFNLADHEVATRVFEKKTLDLCGL